jgi:hypothetical protein
MCFSEGEWSWSGSILTLCGANGPTSDTGYRYATAPEGDPDAVCPAFEGELACVASGRSAILPTVPGVRN